MHNCTHRCSDACISTVSVTKLSLCSFVAQIDLAEVTVCSCCQLPCECIPSESAPRRLFNTQPSHMPLLEISRPSAIAGLQSVSGSRAVAAHCRASGKPGCTSSHLMQLKRYLFTCSCPAHNFVVHAAHIDTLSASWNQCILQAKPGC